MIIIIFTIKFLLREKKLKQIRDEKTSHELDGCTFNPKVSKSCEKILKKSGKIMNNVGVFEKNMLWKRNVEKNIQNKHLIQERKLYQECIFEPQIRKEPILLRSKSVKNDSMYIKSMQWKNKVQTDREKKAEEHQQMLINNSQIVHNKCKYSNIKSKITDRNEICISTTLEQR